MLHGGNIMRYRSLIGFRFATSSYRFVDNSVRFRSFASSTGSSVVVADTSVGSKSSTSVIGSNSTTVVKEEVSATIHGPSVVNPLPRGSHTLNLGKVIRHGVGDGCITLNVGGKEFFTLRSTVAGNSVLADHVARAEKNLEILKNGAVFIDRDPEYFHYILTYLRNRVEYSSLHHMEKATVQKLAKSYIELPSDPKILRELYVESVFYRMPELQKSLSESSVMVQMAAVISKTTGNANPFDWLIKFWVHFRTAAIATSAIGGGYVVVVQNEWNWMLQKVGLRKKERGTQSMVFT
jgi:hypothetical protein